MEKEEKISTGREKGSLAKEKHERKEKQEKITNTLNKFPENRRKFVKSQLEKERRLEIWKKYRQNKGKKGTDPNIRISLSEENLDKN